MAKVMLIKAFSMEHLCSPNLSLRCCLTAHNDPGSFPLHILN